MQDAPGPSLAAHVSLSSWPCSRGAALVCVVAAILALVAAPAAAAPPIADFTFSPEVPLPGQTVGFDAASSTAHKNAHVTAWSWEFGDGGTADGTPTPQHTYSAPGQYTVTLTVTDSKGQISAPRQRQIRVNAPPQADFVFLPLLSLPGQSTTFVSTSRDPDDPIEKLTLAWSFGDGSPAATGPTVSHSYADPGTWLATLTAVDPYGAFHSVEKPVPVLAGAGQPQGAPRSPLPGPGSPAPTPAPDPDRTTPRLLSPFPIVRLAGFLTTTGARIRLLTVRTPRGSRVTLHCRGKSCPFRRTSRVAAGRPVRVRSLERFLRAGTVIEVLVSGTGRIGKYTRFVIRAGLAPRRTDLCLWPGGSRGRACPSD